MLAVQQIAAHTSGSVDSMYYRRNLVMAAVEFTIVAGEQANAIIRDTRWLSRYAASRLIRDKPNKAKIV